MKQLIIGGARSGKSRLAQNYALTWQARTQGDVIVIATAEVSDGAMAKRIAHHQLNRPSHWLLAETTLALSATLHQYSQVNNLIIVDCLTLWLANVQLSTLDWATAKQGLLDCIQTLPGEVILISNEVGQGVVPLGELSRTFVDESGWLHQSLALHVDQVSWVIAGLPLMLKTATPTEITALC
jgi:adenosylcobinamide kinase/adenosylcobinamide-phosphate guanylyltransferase